MNISYFVTSVSYITGGSSQIIQKLSQNYPQMTLSMWTNLFLQLKNIKKHAGVSFLPVKHEVNGTGE